MRSLFLHILPEFSTNRAENVALTLNIHFLTLDFSKQNGVSVNFRTSLRRHNIVYTRATFCTLLQKGIEFISKNIDSALIRLNIVCGAKDTFKTTNVHKLSENQSPRLVLHCMYQTIRDFFLYKNSGAKLVYEIKYMCSK